jgi:hypothetical protein
LEINGKFHSLIVFSRGKIVLEHIGFRTALSVLAKKDVRGIMKQNNDAVAELILFDFSFAGNN